MIQIAICDDEKAILDEISGYIKNYRYLKFKTEKVRRKTMKSFNAEMIEKAKTVKSAEELLELAKGSNVEMTADEAATYFAQLNPKGNELSNDDLDAVAGGASGCSEEDDEPESMEKTKLVQ